MGAWRVTGDDRGEDGRIKINTFDDEVARALRDVGAEPLAALEEEETRAAPVVRRWERDAALLMCGLLVGVALFALIGRSSPAPAAPRPPLAVATAAPTTTPAPSATIAPTVTPTEAPPTAVPAEAPALFAPPPTPCDPATAPYQVKQQVFPIGSVIGISCASADEAQANADALAAAMIATATAEARR